MNSAKFDYLGIKTLAEELGRPVSTLYALSANNDPFYIAPARAKAAAWFAEEWRRLKIATGWHYRRIHYVFVVARRRDRRRYVKWLAIRKYARMLG